MRMPRLYGSLRERRVGVVQGRRRGEEEGRGQNGGGKRGWERGGHAVEQGGRGASRLEKLLPYAGVHVPLMGVSSARNLRRVFLQETTQRDLPHFPGHCDIEKQLREAGQGEKVR